MTRTIPSVLFMSAIILTLAFVGTLDFVSDADAKKAQGTYVQKYGSATDHIVCGDRLCSEVEEETTVGEEETSPPPPKKKEEQKQEKKMAEEKKATEPMKEMEKKMATTELPSWQTKADTLTSSQDPGIGHESHQLAVILPPSDKIYRGQLTYTASEPIQLVALHGPLGPGEDKGQPIWTPDGETKFALTLVDNEANMGTWKFAGNALAVHTFNEEPFTVSYSVTYRERISSDLVTTTTVDSMQDPGIGHEMHQLAIILPPSDKTYNGILTYSASEPIQLVALHGPLLPGQDKGQPIWTPDGETKFALTFIDPQKNMGSWAFSGNAIAVHTLNTDTFTTSYSVVAGP